MFTLTPPHFCVDESYIIILFIVYYYLNKYVSILLLSEF